MPRASTSLSRFAVSLLAALAVACGPDVEPGDTDAANLPTAWDPGLTETARTEPLSTAELEEGLAEALAYLHRQDPLFHHEAWTEVFWDNAETESCPVLGEHNGQDYWRDDCTTSGGARFNGWTLNFRRGGWMHDEGMRVVQYNWLSGHAYIVTPAGVHLQNFGDIELMLGDAGDWNYMGGFVFGDFAWQDDRAVDTWLQEPVSTEIYFEFYDHGAYQSAWYDGGMTYLLGPVLAARFEEIVMDDAPGSCAREPSGGVRLRDHAGLWVDVAYGATGEDDAACDGCGDASFEGAALGQVCADWTPLVTWEGWPWDR